MSRAFDVAVLGATGLVGQHMIEILEQRGFSDQQTLSISQRTFCRWKGDL